MVIDIQLILPFHSYSDFSFVNLRDFQTIKGCLSEELTIGIRSKGNL